MRKVESLAVASVRSICLTPSRLRWRQRLAMDNKHMAKCFAGSTSCSAELHATVGVFTRTDSYPRTLISCVLLSGHRRPALSVVALTGMHYVGRI